MVTAHLPEGKIHLPLSLSLRRRLLAHTIDVAIVATTSLRDHIHDLRGSDEKPEKRATDATGMGRVDESQNLRIRSGKVRRFH